MKIFKRIVTKYSAVILLILCLSVASAYETAGISQPGTKDASQKTTPGKKTAEQINPEETKPAAKKADANLAPAAATAKVIVSKTPNEALNLKKFVNEVACWMLVAEEWQGLSVPDFNMTDIEGNAHKLSDYRGKDVLILSWAVWCPGCKAQIPLLIDLRNQTSKDKVAILGFAIKTKKDNLQMVKDYVKKAKVNFPVFYVDINSLPAPLGANKYVPCNFFINPDGKFKIGIENIVNTIDLKKVIAAR